MKKYILIIAILLLNVLTSNAQYSLMVKGERCPFDSAVAVRLDIYRLETKKMRLADELIVNLKTQVGEIERVNLSLNKQLILSSDMLKVKDEVILNKQLTIDQLLEKIDYKPEKTWWERNHKPVIFVGGFSVGVGGVILITNLLK